MTARHMHRTCRLALFAWAVAFVLTGACNREPPVNALLLDVPTTVGTDGLIVQAPEPISRVHKHAEANVILEEEWSSVSRSGVVVFPDGEEARIRVAVETASGRQFVATWYGRSGKVDLTARFWPEIPLGEKIARIHVWCEKSITVERLSWNDWHPL